MTETVWPAKPKIFTHGPLRKNVPSYAINYYSTVSVKIELSKVLWEHQGVDNWRVQGKLSQKIES